MGQTVHLPATGFRHDGQVWFWLSHVARQRPQNMCPQLSVWQATSQSWQMGQDKCDARMVAIRLLGLLGSSRC